MKCCRFISDLNCSSKMKKSKNRIFSSFSRKRIAAIKRIFERGRKILFASCIKNERRKYYKNCPSLGMTRQNLQYRIRKMKSNKKSQKRHRFWDFFIVLFRSNLEVFLSMFGIHLHLVHLNVPVKISLDSFPLSFVAGLAVHG